MYNYDHFLIGISSEHIQLCTYSDDQLASLFTAHPEI